MPKRPLPNTRSYPKTIKILDDIWTVRFVRGYADPDQVGECDPNAYEITIKFKQSKADTFKTFIHEICHAIEFTGNLEIKHRTIYKLEDLIFSLIRENFYG
jgi:hypothetical protein